MSKIKKLFNKLAISFAVLGMLTAGAFFVGNDFVSTDKHANAVFSEYKEISNPDLPQYVEITASGDTSTQVGNVDNLVYLFQNDSYQDVIIGSDTIVHSGDATKINYGYYPNETDKSIYYYFDFQTSLSLYYNLTNEDIKNGLSGENLLKSQAISNFTQKDTNLDDDKIGPFVPTGYSFTPQKFNIQFRLNANLEETAVSGNQVTLSEEGCYTLAIPVSVYRTDNNGLTFTLSETTIYYTFMIFNANTYFDGVTGRPNITPSPNMQEALLPSSSAYSNYYYYNFSYGQSINTLPTISYNPERFELRVEYTDIEQQVATAVIEYSNGIFRQLDENGNEIPEKNQFLKTKIVTDKALQSQKAVLTFTELGSYDLSIAYLYISKTENSQTTYRLPLEKLAEDSESSLVFKNKPQRLYVYGYQAVYSDYASINNETNQPESKELKTFDFTNDTYGYDNNSKLYTNSADITSALNKYIIESEVDGTGDKEFVDTQHPNKSSNFDLEWLADSVQNYINSNEDIQPISTNQTPVKFITNARLDANYSKMYSVETIMHPTADGVEKKVLSEIDNFQGFNQNSAGTYLYIVQYKFDSYMSTSGTLQSGFYHYQVFYFTVTNSTPTITVYDSQFSEIYTGGYTNKSVYILNDAENNLFDAKVEITLSAQDYKTGAYHFPATSIDSLSQYGLTYQQFEASADTENDATYNKLVAGKYGIIIENTSRYANSLFTVQIKSANSDKPSTRTFTIDTNPIENIEARSASISSSTTYRIGENFSAYATNKPFVLSWDEKDSGAATYGYIKYIPMTSINYYSSLSDDKLAELLSRLIAHDTLPVSYKLDLAKASAWTELANSKNFTTTVPATYVKSNDGVYILEVYDQAGNNAFSVFMKDSSSPIFIEEIEGDNTTRKLISNSDSISVPDAGVNISINWTSNKAIYIENLSSYSAFEAYKYGIDWENATQNLQTVLEEFFNVQNNSNLQNFKDITVETTKDGATDYAPTGINSYNGIYLIVPINERAYIKDTEASDFSAYDSTSYQIDFIDDNDEAIEGTYKILIRDSSNTDNYANEALNYKLYPSGYLTFNVTSDASKLSVQDSEGNALDYASYSLTGKLYSYKDENEKTYYTHHSDNGLEETEDGYKTYDETNLAYKFLYNTPINADNELVLSYIPVADNGSKLQSIVLTYYPYELASKPYTYTVKEDDKEVEKTRYYYYYTISKTPSRTINVFTLSDKNYDPGQVETFEIALGTDSYPLAGRYVIERTYVDGNATDKYDYFKRTISLIVDDFNLISPLESVTNEDKTASSLESVVGGDIILSMYSDENLASIEVSFPRYNENGLSTGSFYSKDSFTESETLSVFAVEGNKLPMSLYVPKAKYTVASYDNVNANNKKYYTVESNNDISYYGYASYEQNKLTGMYDVYVEGVVVDSFGTAEMAQAYIDNNISIAEYQIYAEIVATVIENGKEVTKYYYSNGTSSNGYLNFYLGNGEKEIIETEATNYFFLKGKYVVTLYQANNIGSTSNFYTFYKFGFEIVSQEPEFTIYGSDGYELTTIEHLPNVYYTNSDLLTIEWEVPTSDYQAKIDENSIVINSYPSTSPAIRSKIEDGTGTRWFTLDTSRLIVTENSYITITMQYEGYNSNYYSQITKTIYFDRSAPTQNLVGLMTLTESATSSAFPVNYQQYFMRKYYDYKNQEVSSTAGIDLTNMSYSYSVDSGYFKYYSYNVTTAFFNETLNQTLTNAQNFIKDTQFIYYKTIPNINAYTQVDKSSFSSRSYIQLFANSEAEIACGYYEIVELDYAGNMTVYIVYVVDSSLEDDQAVRNDALTYFNNTHANIDPITNDQIVNGFNIYSNSGFEVSELNYKSDPWALLNVTIAGQGVTRFMKSPWLEENSIYKVTFSASGIEFEQISLSKMFEGVDSSSSKHQLVFTDRITGTSALVYLSIMDASISTQKVEDPAKSSAILNITIPSSEQYSSTTTSYAFPTKITIKQFDKNLAEPWKTIMVANQIAYGDWQAEYEYQTALEYISFSHIAGNILQVSINLGENASQKIMYEIEDNFGNVTTIIQLANEVSYREISGDGNVYQFAEADNSTTYISSQTIKYSYNVLLYNVKIFDKNGNDITADMAVNKVENSTTNISVYSFRPSETNIYDDLYKIEVRDLENADDPEPKVIHIRLVYNLPYMTFVANEVHSGGIIFNDKNQQPIDKEDVISVSSLTTTFNGKTFTTSGYSISSYDNVTLRFKNGQDYAYEGSFEYQYGYTYSVYLSNDNGQTWQNINSANSAISGYTISGVGEYTILIKYDSDDVFNGLCKIFTVSIIDQDKFPLYSIRVDNLPVEKSNIKFTSRNNIGYEVNYVVSVDWADKDNRLSIITNEEKGVTYSIIDEYSTGSNVHVEIYHYQSQNGLMGDFTILYIEETNNIVSTFTYDTTAGTTSALKDTSYAMIVADKDKQENNFNKLKLNFSSFYGIEENKINVEVLKLFNGSYVEIDCEIDGDDAYSYIYLERAGSYRIKLYDSCTPANVQTFKTSDYIDIVFLSSVPFLVSHADENGEIIVTEPIQKAIYNTDVTIELTNLYSNSYYQTSGYPVISVQLNGKNYTGYKLENRKYTFSDPGFYTVKFSATSKTGISIREEEYNFSIIKKNELKFAYELSQYSNYYVEKVEKDGVDITNALINFGNFKTDVIDGQTRLTGLTISHSLQDEKTGDGRYKITVNQNNSAYKNVIGESFTFEIRIGYIVSLPINVSIDEGQSTSKNIVVSFNVQNLYNAVGDCYLTVGDITRVYTAETLASYSEVESLTITGSGTHYIQVYTLSGRPLYSYKVVKTAPLNAFAIIAIIIGVIALVAIIGITIAIRKRQKVK